VARLPEAWKEKTVEACEGSALTAAMTDKGPQYLVRLGELSEGLTRIPIAVLGRFVKGAQKFAITKGTLADVVRNFRARKADTVIDYEHASEEPGVAAGGPVPASGWLKAVEDAPDENGILWGQAEFTPRAQEMVKGGEYKYLSPVINWGARNKVTGEQQGATLTSMALTNRPFLEALPAIAMTELGVDADGRPAWRVDRGDAASNGKEKHNVTKVILTDRVARTVRVVNDDGTEQTLTMEGLEAAPKVVKLSDVKRDKEGLFDFASLETGDGVVMASEVFHAMEVQGELQAAVGKGLITPAQRPFYEKMALTDLGAFRELVKTMQPAVDLREHGLAGSGAEGGAAEREKKAAQALETKIAEIRRADPKVQYHEALKLVASEHPEIVKAYRLATLEQMDGREER
jgi:phage I-like protein